MNSRVVAVCALILSLLTATCVPRGGRANDSSVAPASAPDNKSKADQAMGDLYYLPHCPQDDRLLGTRGEPVTVIYDGRHLRFCSPECRIAFEKDLPASFSRLDQKLTADQSPLYPSGQSLVSDRPLRAAVEFVWCNRLIRVNEPSERDLFLADPQTYLDKQNRQIIAHRGPRYTIRGCPVQGTKLDKDVDEQLTVVVAHRIIRVCCSDCANLVRAVPWQYLPLIDYSIRHPETH